MLAKQSCSVEGADSWLCARAIVFAKREGATEADRVVAACMSSYSEMLRVMSEGQHILTVQEAQDFFDHTIRHLRCYSWLYAHGQNAALNTPGRKSWLLLPKMHHLWHVAHDTRQSRLNPRTVTLLSAESYIGVIGRVARKYHRGTVSLRTLERYQIQFAFKLQALVAENG